MPIKGGKVSRSLNFLTRNELYDIHLATLEVLKSVGIEFHESNVLRVLDEAGAYVDYESKQVRLPSNLVKEAIKSSPKTITLCGRTPDYDVKMEDKLVFFGSGANALHILDPVSNSTRDATIEDCVDLARLADALENIHVYLTLVSPLDVPPKGVDRVRCAVALKNTCKHFFHDAQGKDGARDQIQIAAKVVGGMDELRKRPILSLAPCITSPFRWGREAVEVLMTMAEFGLPQIISSEPMAGATSPITLAGSLVQQNAELLSGLTLAHIINKDAPVLLCTLPSIMDMKTGNIAIGSIELGLMSAAMAQLMRYYHLPYVGTGGLTDSKMMDEQTAYEKAMTCLLPALAGTNLVHLSAGMLESILTLSYEQVVIDNEIIGMVLRALRGIEVTDETLAVAIIKQVGAGKHYLKQKHTLRFLRQEHFIPDLADRRTRGSWERMGSKNITRRAREKVDEILSTHQPEPLSKDVEEEIDSIVKGALKRLT